MSHKAVLLLQQMSQWDSQCKQCKAKCPRRMLPLVRTFCFDHFTVQNQTDARIRRTAIQRQTNFAEFLKSKRELLGEHNLHSKCFSFSANLRQMYARRKVLRHRSFVKRNVFMSQSFNCGSHKFRAFKTTSRCSHCTVWFTYLHYVYE